MGAISCHARIMARRNKIIEKKKRSRNRTLAKLKKLKGTRWTRSQKDPPPPPLHIKSCPMGQLRLPVGWGSAKKL